MKEVTFLKRNAQKWKEFENVLADPSSSDPDELGRIYIEVTDDLSYSRTFFPNSRTESYLNDLAAQFHRSIYRNKKERRGRILSFWKSELPRIMGRYHKELFIVFTIFALSVAIGVLSQAYDPTFANLILGDQYVDQTIQNIEKGDPMAIYKSHSRVSSFLGITFNNVRVALVAFALGVIFSVGTAYILFVNGIMLGSFLYFFHQYGESFEAMTTVWLHGTMEISAILIGGCAGFVIGNGILFPGSFPRGTSFRMGAKDGLKIAVGTIPFFLFAGFVEGFITRMTYLPTWVDLTIIFGSLAFVIWYFIIYPIRINKTENPYERSIGYPVEGPDVLGTIR